MAFMPALLVSFLKVGSWSFEGIILLIYFQIVGKHYLQRNKQVSVKCIEIKVLDYPFREGFANSPAHTS